MMNIKKIIGLIGFVIACVSLGCFLVCDVDQKNSNQSGLPSVRIAIFQPATHPALDEIAQGYIDTMQKNALKQYIFDRYNANGNKILMQAQAQEMLQKNYDLIFTIGVGCSVTIKDLAVKKQNNTPVVFTAVDDPVRLDLQKDSMTGVVDQSNYDEQLSLLLKIKPSIQKILLVYDQSQASGLEKDKNKIRLFLQNHAIELVCVEILNIGEIQQKMTGLIECCDVVMVLKDNTVVSGIDSVINLCQRYNVTLLATDLNSGVKGAALAYGIYEAQSGIQAALQAKKILEDGKNPSQVPVVAVENMIMNINCKHAPLQGLQIDCATFSMPGVQLVMQGDSNA
jgi:putative tryptophan/tyrosine transport system substrate-binding protein